MNTRSPDTFPDHMVGMRSAEGSIRMGDRQTADNIGNAGGSHKEGEQSMSTTIPSIVSLPAELWQFVGMWMIIAIVIVIRAINRSQGGI